MIGLLGGFMNKAMILGANYFIGLGVIRRLGRKNVPVVAVDYDENAYGFRSKYISEKLLTPNYREDEQSFLDVIIEYAKKQKEKPVLLPCADPYVEVLDANREVLAEYFLFPTMPAGLQTSLLEKIPLAKHCREHGVLIPETIAREEENFFERVEAEIGYPHIIKPVVSYDFVKKFRHKMFYVNNRKELESYIAKADEAGLAVFVQRIIKGFDDHMYTYDAFLNQEGKVTHWATCRKHRQFPINFGASVYTEQKVVPELDQIGRPFLEAVGYRGFAEIEFKKDADNGKFYLIEINARYTTLDVLIDKCGINMPYVTYRELIGKPLEPAHLTKDSGRYFLYFYEDLLAVREYVRQGQLTRWAVFKSYFHKKAHAIWDFHDQAPFWAFAKMVMKKVRKKM